MVTTICWYSGFPVNGCFVREKASGGYNNVGRRIDPLLNLGGGDASRVGMTLDYVADIRPVAQHRVQDGVGREVQQLGRARGMDSLGFDGCEVTVVIHEHSESGGVHT